MTTDFPASFVDAGGRTCVVPDVISASYDVTIDPATGDLEARSVLELELSAPGHAILDLVPDPTLAAVLGPSSALETTLDLVTLPDGGACRVVGAEMLRGRHRIAIQHRARAAYGERGFVTSMHDGSPRCFLEQWLPIGLEHDALAARMSIAIAGGAPHDLWSNAVRPGDRAIGSRFDLSFPPGFCSSSFFLVVAPRGALTEHRFTVRGVPATLVHPAGSLDGAARRRVEDGMRATADRLAGFYGTELPYASLLVRACGRHMEYAGAMEIDPSVEAGTFHELGHQYLGRSARPASGRSGWFDEAVVEWLWYRCPADNPPNETLPGPRLGLAGSTWQRATVTEAYDTGKTVLGRANKLLAPLGGLAPLVRAVAGRPGPYSLAELRATLLGAAQSDHAIRTELAALWRAWVEPTSDEGDESTMAKRPNTGTKKNAKRSGKSKKSKARPQRLVPVLRTLISSDDAARAFHAAPERYLLDAGVEDPGQRVVMTLDADVIAAFARAEEALTDAQADTLRSDLRDRLGVATAKAAAWPHPQPTIGDVRPKEGSASGILDQLVLEGRGLVDGAIVSLTRLAGGRPDASASRAWIGTVKTRAAYSMRKLRVVALDLRGLPPGSYEVAVANAEGLPRTRYSSTFVITP